MPPPKPSSCVAPCGVGWNVGGAQEARARRAAAHQFGWSLSPPSGPRRGTL